MDNLISREQVIEAIRKAENHAFGSFYKGLVKAHKIIAELPPAQLEKRTEERTETHACDSISRQDAIDVVQNMHMMLSKEKVLLINDLEKLPSAEPKRETATVSVGISKEGVTMWYECDACGEPVDQGDVFCSWCGRELIHE